MRMARVIDKGVNLGDLSGLLGRAKHVSQVEVRQDLLAGFESAFILAAVVREVSPLLDLVRELELDLRLPVVRLVLGSVLYVRASLDRAGLAHQLLGVFELLAQLTRNDGLLALGCRLGHLLRLVM